LFITIAVSIIGMLLGKVLMGVFTDNQEIITLGSNILMMNIFLELGRTTNIILIACLRGAGDVFYPTGCAIFSMWFISVLGSYVFAVVLGLGIYGLWIAFAADELFRGIMMIIRWKGGKWRSKRIAVSQ
jgi:Na+-driven multidrug efflux pump